MDPLIRNLIAAAHRVNVRVDPSRDPDTGHVTITAAESTALTTTARQLMFSSMETAQIARILTRRGAPATALDDRDGRDLAVALGRLAAAADRDRRILRGQYVGPMSASEVVRFTRGTYGL